jgi:hypothetical protein
MIKKGNDVRSLGLIRLVVRDLGNMHKLESSIFYFTLNKTNKNNMCPIRGA